MSPKSQSYLIPTRHEVLLILKDEILKSLRCLMPARITAVHAALGTVDVQISALQQTPIGEYLKYPPLENVPVITLQGGGLAIKAPIKVNDQCLVFFADRCMSAWKQSGSPQPLPNPRMHDLSDGFALVGVNSPVQLLTLLTATEGGIATATAKVAIDTTTNKVTIQNGGGSHNLLTILTSLTTAVNSLNTALTTLNSALALDGGLSGPSHTALTNANLAIATVTANVGLVAINLGLLLQ